MDNRGMPSSSNSRIRYLSNRRVAPTMEAPELGLAPAGLSHEPEKRGRKRKNMDLQVNVASTIVPNSNENGPKLKNIKRRNKNKETGVACIDLTYNKVQQGNEEVKGIALLLKFSPDHPLPPKEILNEVFCNYGSLNESETQVFTENMSGQVVFLDSSSAGKAFWGLQDDQPFGPFLVNYRIQHLSDSKSVIGFKTPIKSPPPVIDPQATSGSTIIPDLNENAAENILMVKSISYNGNAAELMEKSKSFDETHQSSLKKIPLGLKPPQNGETPDLAGMKKNLEMMMLMMDNAGDTLSPSMRAKLESEIKGLMKKLNRGGKGKRLHMRFLQVLNLNTIDNWMSELWSLWRVLSTQTLLE